MKLEIEIPNSVEKIFELLNKGQFLCRDHPDNVHQKLYDDCERNIKGLTEFFINLGIKLINEEEGYIYFAKLHQEDIEHSSNKKNFNDLKDLVPIVAAIYDYDEFFNVGGVVTLSELESKVISNISLRHSFSGKNDDVIRKEVEKLVKRLDSDGYFYLLDASTGKYIALNSFQRLKDFIGRISIRYTEVDNKAESSAEGYKNEV